MAKVRRRRGRIQLHLDRAEREVIGAIVEQITPSLGKVARTTPRAYDDPTREAEYQRWVVPELERGRDADLEVIRDCVSSGEDMTPLTEAQALAWARGLNHLRLAAGGILGIEADGWYESAGDTLRGTPEYRVLMALGMLQEELVAAMEG
ncbi:MAG: DUF2017 family protein [Acidimicrobiales bacterium]